uniref:uncharacterized protein LOC108949321 n=1 Tax=Ciona intestinalis TaxID=7719 RepID=UPI00089DAAAE|nr:uncharacterized protein LOC108949321 [Ciona intestinalis]|eukprot:XP_018666713.1 uncharacterized protein LOC108949321 [Ciona intestinalis]
MTNRCQTLLFLSILCAEVFSESKEISEWSFTACSKSPTQQSTMNFTTKLPSLWYGYDVAVRVIPSDPTVDHEFNATVTEIKIQNNVAIVELNRTDQNMGWDQMPITVIVTETGYDITDYIRRTASVHYSLDEGNYVTNSSSNLVSGLIDKGLSKLPALQSNPDRQPTLSSDDHNGRKYLIFNGIDQVLVTRLNIDTVNVLSVSIVYRIDGYENSTYHLINGLFGNDNHGWKKFVSFTINGELNISGTTSTYSTINARKENVNAAAINVWNVLTVQWDVDGGMDASSVWCNGQLLTRFQAREVSGAPTFAIGDIKTSPIGIPFKGAIGEFLMYRGQVFSDEMITYHHQYFINRWTVSTNFN